MLLPILIFEIRYRLKRPATYIYFGIMFLIALLYGNIMGGGFGVEQAALLTGGGKNLANSPYNLHQIISALAQLPGIFIVAAIMGVPIYRDFEHKTSEIFFTKPISKFEYLAGRFLGSFIVTVAVLSSIGIGMYVSGFLPKVEAEKYGEFILFHYLNPYLVSVIPNIFFSGVIFFAAVSLSRNQMFIYLNAVILLVLLSIAQAVSGQIENKTLGSLIDPTGGTAFVNFTEYWTVAQKNTQTIPLSGDLLTSFGIWMSVAALVLAFAFYKFSFTTSGKLRAAKKQLTSTIKLIADTVTLKRIELPKVSQDFSRKNLTSIFRSLVKRELKGVFTSIIFIAILLIGVLWMVVALLISGQLFETPTLPVTYRILDLLGAQFTLFVIAITVFYSGEMVWAERDKKVDLIYDTLPLPNWISFASKLSALMIIQFAMMTVILVVGTVAQISQGYFKLEVGLYLQSLFGFRIIDFLLFCVLAFFIQVLANNKYFGFFLATILYFFSGLLPTLGLEHKLFAFSSDTGLVYSDMNGYGHFTTGFLVFKLYWGAFALLLAALSNLFWVRGTETVWSIRQSLAKKNFIRASKIVVFAGILVFVIMGSFIFYNTNVLNEYQDSDEATEELADFEKRYKKYQGIAQPKIIAVNLQVDLYPEKRDFSAKGTYVLVNKTEQFIDSLHLNLSGAISYKEISTSLPSEEVLNDEQMAYRILQFGDPLSPGDTFELKFDLAYSTIGFPHSGWNNQVVENGTFFNSSYFPQIGYNGAFELFEDDTRKKYDLPPKDRVPKIDDTVAVKNNFISTDADWIQFEAVVSTAPDQIAITPGYLQREWDENGRKYFHYKMDVPMLNFYSVVSANYQVMRDTWYDTATDRTINLEIYHHQGHEYNLQTMMDAMKKSLAYFSKNFSPYQHKQLRILEFPRYASFAQSFANTIPYSEGVGFIADVSNEEDVNYPYYITAHEVAHQWWAHQVIGGNVQGSQFLSETMSQYGALMVMKQELNDEQIKKYLRLEMNNYLQGRSRERREEMPAWLSEFQQYIHYNKGTVIMYALQDYLGEDALNAALRSYIQKVQFQEAPYTTTKEFLTFIEEVTPDSLLYVIDDLFRDITIYENKISEATYTEIDSNRYQVTIKIEAKKLKADGFGNEAEVPVNDYVDIGIFGRERVERRWEETVLYFKKHKITSADQELVIYVDKEPRNCGIDPYYKLIDKKPDDNTARVKLAEE